MQRLSLAEFELEPFDEVVASTPHIDLFCSSSAWILPAHAALHDSRDLWLLKGRHGYGAFMHWRYGDGVRGLQPLESAWFMASPLVGKEPIGLAQEFADHVRFYGRDRAGQGPWDFVMIAGVLPQSPVLGHLTRALEGAFQFRIGRPTRRYVASLDGGLEGFLGRRSRNFRKALRRSQRLGDTEGITYDNRSNLSPDEADAHFERILAVERRSWKGRGNEGINQGPMGEFYRQMLRRLAQNRTARLIFACRDGGDVGYILGAEFAGTYRGLQFSYDNDQRQLSLGNLLQVEQIRHLPSSCHLYDLGSDVDYKRQWGELEVDTAMLLICKIDLRMG